MKKTIKNRRKKKMITAVLLSVAVAGQTYPAYPTLAGQTEAAGQAEPAKKGEPPAEAVTEEALKAADKRNGIEPGEPVKASGQASPAGQEPGAGTGQADPAGQDSGTGTGQAAPAGQEPGAGTGQAEPGGQEPGEGTGQPEAGGSQEGGTEQPDMQAVQGVQNMIDALPGADTITTENLENVRGQLAAVDAAKAALNESQQAALDLTGYTAAAERIAAVEAEQQAEAERRAEEERLAAEREQNTFGNPAVPTTAKPTPEPKQQPTEEPDEAKKLMSPAGVSDAQNRASGIRQGDGYKFNEADGMLTITNSNGFTCFAQPSNTVWRSEVRKIVISGSVVSIPYWAFRGCGNLTDVECTAQVQVIEGDAFRECANLVSVRNVTGVTEVGDYAFADSKKLQNVELASVTKIGQSVFKNCESLTSAGTLSNVTSLGSSAFRNCSNLTSADLRAAAEVGEYTFAGCGKLENVNLASVIKLEKSVFANCSSLTSVDLASVTELDGFMFAGSEKLTSVNLSSVTRIGSSAFEDCGSLTSVGSLSNVTSLGAKAFRYCGNLTSVDLTSLTKVEDYTFRDCKKLESVGLASATWIGKAAFENCESLTNAGTLAKVTYLGQSAFRNCKKLTNVDLAAATEISKGAFQDCASLTDAGSMENVTTMGENAFRDCQNLASVKLAAVTVIGRGAFENCYNLADVGSLEKVTQIGVSAFRSCGKLTSVKLSSITNLANNAFRDCSGLTTVELPMVTNIGNSAFQSCGSLTGVELPVSLQTIGEYGFDNCPRLNRIYLPKDATVNKSSITGNACQVRYTVSGEGDGRKATITDIQKGGNTFAIPETICGIPVVKVTATYNGTLTHEGRKHIITTDTWGHDATYHWKICDLCQVVDKAAHSGGSANAEGKAECAVCSAFYQKAVQEAPKISIDYEKEELNTTTAMEYSVDGGETWKNCTEKMKVSDSGIGWSGTAERKIKIRMKETDSSLESAAADVVIPARPVLSIKTIKITTRVIEVAVSGAPNGSKAEVKMDGGYWATVINSVTYAALKAGTSYRVWGRCSAVAVQPDGSGGSFAAEISKELRTEDAVYTISIPSRLEAGGNKAEICVDDTQPFELGNRGKVNVFIAENTNGYDGNVKLERENAYNAVTSVLKVGENKLDSGQITSFDYRDYIEGAVTIQADAPKPADGTVIPAGQYRGTVTFQITYEQ